MTNANNINPAPFLVEDEELTDEEVMMEMPLDLIINELRRRHCPIIFANSIGMVGRIIVVPAALEVQRAQSEKAQFRQEVRRRVAEQSATGAGRVGVPPERQVHDDLEPKGADTRVLPVTRRPDLQRGEEEFAVRVQGGSVIIDSVPEGEGSSTTGTPGV